MLILWIPALHCMKWCFSMSPLCNINYSGMSPLCNIYTSGMPAINMENTTGKMTLSYGHTGSHIHACTPNTNSLADTCPSGFNYIGHCDLNDNLLSNWLNFDQKGIGENIHITLVFQSNSHERCNRDGHIDFRMLGINSIYSFGIWVGFCYIYTHLRNGSYLQYLLFQNVCYWQYIFMYTPVI